MDDPLKITRNGAVLEIVLERPKANAIDGATSCRMGDVFAEFRDDPKLRVAILTGGGDKFFSAGWDLKAASQGEAYDSDYGVGGFGGLQELPNLNKPVIGAINGMAVGGGFEIALACDIILCADHARFAVPEINIGVLADAATIKLPKRVPYNIAMEMLLTGRWMEVEEAKHWGLVNEVVPAGNLMRRAREVARLLAEGPPLVFACIKDAIRRTETLSVQESFDLFKSGSCKSFNAMLTSEDAKEGPLAFAEKRKPVWKGY